MSQVIEVRLLSPEGEIFTDQFTKTDEHKRAIELVLSAWTEGDISTVNSAKKIEGEGIVQGRFYKGAYQYIYSVLVSFEDEEKAMLAVLFTTYPEKGE
jgi:hypothetical protein